MPYRIDVDNPPDHAFETLVDLGALDVEPFAGGLAAIMPDSVSVAVVATALGVPGLRVSPPVGRDDDSVWTLTPRPARARTLLIMPSSMPSVPGALRLSDGPAFGTGLHATTALCLEAIEDLLDVMIPAAILDVGTGSGVLALAALRRGVARAVGLDINPAALQVAAENARINDLAGRLALVRGGPAVIRTSWPLVVANIRAAELMELAPTLVRRVTSGGWLVLSGIPGSVTADVERTYRHLGMTQVSLDARDGWTVLVLRPTW